MLLSLKVSKTVIINTGIKRVWFILTDPDHIKQYLYGTETITTWKPGSEIIFQGVYNDQAYKDKGRIIEFTPETRIVYTYWSAFSGVEDKAENYSVITYTLKDLGSDQTEFTWTQEGFASEEGYKHSENGMYEFLQAIKKIAES